jgi:hypothetical protein
MNCADVQRVLPEMDEGVRNEELQAHVNSCPACSELISELELIASEARQIAESEEPSPALWFRIADQLRSEGLIREPETQPLRPGSPARPVSAHWGGGPVLVTVKRRSWNAWWLVPVAAVLIVSGVFLMKPKPAGDVAQQTAETQAPTNPQKTLPTEAQLGASTSTQAQLAEDQQFLDEVSERAPMMKAAYENELRSVNSYINETRAYAQQNPNDEDARRQVMQACEQKQMFYQMALSNIQ